MSAKAFQLWKVWVQRHTSRGETNYKRAFLTNYSAKLRDALSKCGLYFVFVVVGMAGRNLLVRFHRFYPWTSKR